MSLMINDITVKTIQKICKDEDDLFVKSIRSYFSLSPYVIGKLGCFWMNEYFFSWFENYYMIRIVVIHPFQINDSHHSYVWEQNALNYTEDPGGDYLSKIFNSVHGAEVNEKIFQPYGLIFVVKEDDHYSKLLFRRSSDSPLFRVGNPLPENLLTF